MLCFSLGSRLRGNDVGVRGNDGGCEGMTGGGGAVSPSPPVQTRGRLWPSPIEGPLHNSISVLSQYQIDDLSPFAPPRWMDVPSAEAPAYAGMTLVVQRSPPWERARVRGHGINGRCGMAAPHQPSTTFGVIFASSCLRTHRKTEPTKTAPAKKDRSKASKSSSSATSSPALSPVRILADMGAEVIKVEPPNGDPWRSTQPFAPGESRTFLPLNRGVKSVTLNLKDEKGQNALAKIVKMSDGVISNNRPDTAKPSASTTSPSPPSTPPSSTSTSPHTA